MKPLTDIKVATIAMCSRSDRADNLARAFAWVREAAEAGADWVVLPEVFAYIGPYSDAFSLAEPPEGLILPQLQRLCQQLGIVLFAGSMGEQPRSEDPVAEKGKVYNTLWVINRLGAVVGKYRKTHLFNLRNAAGEAVYCESDVFIPGQEAVAIQVDGWQVGLSICYDLRFGEYYQCLQEAGLMDVIMVPSAFTFKTGSAHWELLLRARAVEFQAFVVAANQVGDHAPGKRSYGHSMVVDPWGEVLDSTADKEGFVIKTLSRQRLRDVREQLPALAGRRQDLYL